jgi:uncharacterized protein (UPF0218 family)
MSIDDTTLRDARKQRAAEARAVTWGHARRSPNDLPSMCNVGDTRASECFRCGASIAERLEIIDERGRAWSTGGCPCRR